MELITIPMRPQPRAVSSKNPTGRCRNGLARLWWCSVSWESYTASIGWLVIRIFCLGENCGCSFWKSGPPDIETLLDWLFIFASFRNLPDMRREAPGRGDPRVKHFERSLGVFGYVGTWTRLNLGNGQGHVIINAWTFKLLKDQRSTVRR